MLANFAVPSAGATLSRAQKGDIVAEESQLHMKDLPDSPQEDKHLAWRHLICCFLPGSAWPAVLGVFIQHLTKMAR